MSNGFKHYFFAREVVALLQEAGCAVFLQDHDIPIAASSTAEMDDGIKGSRDLVVRVAADYAAVGACWNGCGTATTSPPPSPPYGRRTHGPGWKLG